MKISEQNVCVIGIVFLFIILFCMIITSIGQSVNYVRNYPDYKYKTRVEIVNGLYRECHGYIKGRKIVEKSCGPRTAYIVVLDDGHEVVELYTNLKPEELD